MLLARFKEKKTIARIVATSLRSVAAATMEGELLSREYYSCELYSLSLHVGFYCSTAATLASAGYRGHEKMRDALLESTRVNVLCPTYSGMLKWALDGLVGSDGRTREGIGSGDVTSVCIIPLHCLDFLFFLFLFFK